MNQNNSIGRIANWHKESQVYRSLAPSFTRTVPLERTIEVHSLAAQAAEMTGSASELRVVALCMAPAGVHTEQNLRSSTQSIMDGLGAAFDASKENPLGQLVFIDIARIEEVLEILPKPTPLIPRG